MRKTLNPKTCMTRNQLNGCYHSSVTIANEHERHTLSHDLKWLRKIVMTELRKCLWSLRPQSTRLHFSDPFSSTEMYKKDYASNLWPWPHTHLSETLVGGYKPLVKPAVHPSLPNLHTPAISPSDERAEGARGRMLSICETREAAMMKRRLASSTFEFKATQVPPNAAEQAPSCSPTRHSSLSLTPCSSLPLSLNLKTLLHCDLLLR